MNAVNLALKAGPYLFYSGVGGLVIKGYEQGGISALSFLNSLGIINRLVAKTLIIASTYNYGDHSPKGPLIRSITGLYLLAQSADSIYSPLIAKIKPNFTAATYTPAAKIPRPLPPIENPFILTCGLDDKPIPSPSMITLPPPQINIPAPASAPLEQSSSLLPIIGAAAVIGILGFGAFKLYQKYTETSNGAKKPHEMDPSLNEIRDAVASYRNTDRYFAVRYTLSSLGFAKAALFNMIRAIKHIALSILSIPVLVIQSGRDSFRANAGRILPSLRQSFISLAGIPLPPLAVKAYL